MRSLGRGADGAAGAAGATGATGAAGGGGYGSLGTQIYVKEEFSIGDIAGGQNGWVNITSVGTVTRDATGSYQDSDKHDRGWVLATGANAAGYAGITLGRNATAARDTTLGTYLLGNSNKRTRWSWIFKIPVLASAGTQEFIFRCGLGAGAALWDAPATGEGMYFEYNRVLSNKFRYCVNDNGMGDFPLLTASDVLATPDTAWHKFDVDFNYDGNFTSKTTLDGTVIASGISSQGPGNNRLSPFASLRKTTGATSMEVALLAFEFQQDLTASR